MNDASKKAFEEFWIKYLQRGYRPKAAPREYCFDAYVDSRKQTLRDVLALLPEKNKYQKIYSDIDEAYSNGEVDGFNDCLDEIRSRIEKAMGE